MLARKLALSNASAHWTLKNVTSISNANFQYSRDVKVFHAKFLSHSSAQQNFHSAIAHNKFSLARILRPITYANAGNYSTQNPFKLTETSASQLQPYLDVKNVMRLEDLIQDSINKRQITRKQVKEIRALYQRAEELMQIKEKLNELKNENTEKFQALRKDQTSGEEKTKALADLQEKGRMLREEIRDAENKFNQVNDELVDFIISLPNILDDNTPTEVATLLKETKSAKSPPWESPDYTAIETSCGPGLLAEFPVGQTAWMDIGLRSQAQTHLLDAEYVETGNAEYVKRIILHGAGIDQSQFLRIREPNMKKGLEHATYLAGGASFPSFLALFAQSVIEDANILPLRYFVIGRSYESQGTKPGYYQSHAVQVVVACRDEEEMGREVANLQKIMESFYSEKVGFAFKTQIVPAHGLQMYEKKKLAFLMDETDKSPSRVIGSLSTVGDYVSKRLLCCYFDDKKRSRFLHLITARFFDITNFLRSSSPKLISHSDILAKVEPSQLVLRINDNIEQEDPSRTK